MANRYWVGGTANWDGTAGSKWATTSGGAGGASVPTAADEVYVDANSGSGTITIPSATTVVCRRLDFTGYTGTFSLANTTTCVLSIGDSTAATGNSALTLSSGMSNLSGLGNNGIINFISTSAVQQTITSNGKVTPSMAFNGVGSSYLFADSSSVNGTLTFAQGTLDTNNINHTWAAWSSTGTSPRTATLGSSTLTCNSWVTRLIAGNITFTANTATVLQTGTGSNFDNNSIGGGGTYNGMSLVQSGSGVAAVGLATGAANAITLANYTRTGTAAKTDSLVITSSGLTCSGTFTVTGNSLTNRVLVSGPIAAKGTPSIVTTAAFSLANADFTDITAAGTGGTWSGTSLGDGLGNSNIMFTSSVTRYAAAAGNWSSTAMWANSSGGSTGASVPLCHDTVYLDSNSASGTYSMDMPRLGRDIICTGFTHTVNSTVEISMYGSITLSSGMTISTTGGGVNLLGRGSHTITSAGKTWNVGSGSNPFVIHAYGGSYTLQDAFTMTGGSATNAFQILSGTFNDSDYPVSVRNFLTSGVLPRTFGIGVGGWSLTSTGTSTLWSVASTTGLTFSQIGDITVSTATTGNRNFFGGGLSYKTVNYTLSGSTGSLTVTGSCYIETLNFSDASNARSLLIATGQVLTVKNFNVVGASGRLVTLACSTSGSPAYVKIVGSPTSGVDYLSVQDIYATIPDKFYVGNNSTNVSGNTNVGFTTNPGGLLYSYQTYTSFGTSITSFAATYLLSPPAGSLLVGVFACPGNPGTVTPPAGFTLVDSSNDGTNVDQVFIYSKIADGTETDGNLTTSSVQSAMWAVYNIAGFSGTPTYDVSSKNNGSGASTTSLLTNSGTAPVNTGAPAIAIVGVSGASSLSSSVSVTNGFAISRETTEATNGRSATKALSSTGNVETTYTWTTLRRASILLVVFKDVVTSSSSGNMLLMFS